MNICKSVVVITTLLCSYAAAENNQATSPPRRTMKYTSRSPEHAGTWQNNVRARLSKLLKINDLLASKDSIHLAPKELSSADKGTYCVKELQINSTSTRRIRIVVTLPTAPKGSCPAVVCIGGHGSNRYSPYNEDTVAKDSSRIKSDHLYKGFGTALAKRGYVTVSANVSQHNIHEKDRSLMGERLWDMIRCVDYLESLDRVDGSAIGCAGLSLGGEMAMWLGGMDERIAATVSAGFLTDMDHLEQNHCLCWKFAGLREAVDFADIYSLAAPRALQCQNGLFEPPSQFYAPLARKAMEEVRTIYCDLAMPENAVLDIHPGAHEIDLPGLLYFLEKHLQTNRPRESEEN